MHSSRTPWWIRLLSAGPWLAAFAIAAAPLSLPGLPWVRPAMIASFLVVALARVLVAAASAPHEHRAPMLAMGLGLALFTSGSLVLATNPTLQFPSPVEVVFGGAYVCFVWFLVVDANGGRARNIRTLLETGVVAGGIISVAVFAVVIPAGARIGLDGVPLLVAMTYPIADLVLITTVLTQLFTGRRVAGRRSALLLGGLTMLAAVDTSLPLGLGAAGYAFTTLQDLVWALSLAALAETAVRHSGLTVQRTGIGSIVPVGAGLCALLLLVARGGSHPAWMTEVPASVTIVLLLGLLLSSLREARRGIEAQRLSLTDDLTSIGNRRAVMEVLTVPIGQSVSLILIDLDGFKVVNDTLGHQQGDLLLQRFADRLAGCLRDAEVIARLGGDEFAVLYRDLGAEAMTQRAEALLLAMCRPLDVGEMSLTVGLSIGMSSDHDGQALGVELLRRADVAMYAAKNAGEGYRWYDPAADNFSADKLHLVEDLRHGINDNQLRVYYQPQVRAGDGELVAVEALARWQHPTRGVLPPSEFLPVARKSGLMLAFSLKVIDLAVAQAARWADQGNPLRLSLNVDPPELLSGQWVPALITALDRHRLDPAAVTVELTEELLITDINRATTMIRELTRHGVAIAIDDFGTGYSGLSWLQTLPITELKLDVAFVSRILTDERTFHIVESTIALANRLSIRVVAEGVEDDDTARVLTSLGTHLLQGFAIAHPLMPDALDSWRLHHSARGPVDKAS